MHWLSVLPPNFRNANWYFVNDSGRLQNFVISVGSFLSFAPPLELRVSVAVNFAPPALHSLLAVRDGGGWPSLERSR